VVHQVLAVDLLGVGRAARVEQRLAEEEPRRLVPRRRLVVLERVGLLDRVLVVADRVVVLLRPVVDVAGQERCGDAQDRPRRVEPDDQVLGDRIGDLVDAVARDRGPVEPPLRRQRV